MIELPLILWGLFISTVGYVKWGTDMPGKSFPSGPQPPYTESELAWVAPTRATTEHLSLKIGERNIPRKYEALEQAAVWIEAEFKRLGFPKVERQEFTADGKKTRNLIVEVPGQLPASEGIWVVGAHYDTAETSPGADDNATGVAGLLEMAKRARLKPYKHAIRFVAFTNEEPPYFWTEEMGSLVYARSLAAAKTKVLGMLSLETIGYYSDKEGTQVYPFPISGMLKTIGDYITFVGDSSSRGFVKKFTEVFRQKTPFPSEGAAMAGWIDGIGWSDHWSFSQVGYLGLQISDTAYLRNLHYHTPEDLPGVLDFEKMGRVMEGVETTLRTLDADLPQF
jgi:hypothetical protein